MKNVIIPVLLIGVFLYGFDSTGNDRQVTVNVDWAVFQYDEHNLFLEIYYSFPQNAIDYKLQNDKFVGLTMTRLNIFKDETLFKELAWKNQNMIDDSLQMQQTKMIIDRLVLQIEPAQYQFKFILQDLQDEENGDSCSWSIELSTPEPDKPGLSDIQLASSIRQDPQAHDSPFYKNTLVVEPNPSLIFSKTTPMLFFYAEAYHLSPARHPDGYYVNYYITDGGDKPVATIQPKKVHKTQVVHPSVEFGMANVGRLASGTYFLQVQILDAQEKVIAAKTKKFFIYQDDEKFVQEAGTDIAIPNPINIFQSMDSLIVEQEFLMISYLLDLKTKKVWSEITNLAGKRNFLFQFWQLRDPNPSTMENEMRREYLKRVEYANSHFRAFQLDGWRTDRGRVYLVYGPPSDVERHASESNYYPYEIWNYHHLQTGVIFVFADLEGYKNYRLLHSNLLGEIQDYNYLNTIQKGF